jgi:hypothetical protein
MPSLPFFVSNTSLLATSERLDYKLELLVASAVAPNVAMSAYPGAIGGEADMARASRSVADNPLRGLTMSVYRARADSPRMGLHFRF